jgi:hypothetical protein
MIDLMFRRCALIAAAVAAILGSSGELRAALIISNFNTPLTENFNTFAGTFATIPANFTWTPDGALNTATNFERGYYNSALDPYITNNGLYADYYSNPDVPPNQRDVAFSTKRQPNSTPIILAWSFINQTGADISEFSVSWDVEQYTQGGRATRIDFDYDPNGAGPTQAGIVGTTLTTATTVAAGGPLPGENLPSPIITSRTVSISLATPLANGQPIDFRWVTLPVDPNNPGNGGNAHFGVDNLSVTAIPEPSAAWLCGWGCIAGLTRVLRRRRSVTH